MLKTNENGQEGEREREREREREGEREPKRFPFLLLYLSSSSFSSSVISWLNKQMNEQVMGGRGAIELPSSIRPPPPPFNVRGTSAGLGMYRVSLEENERDQIVILSSSHQPQFSSTPASASGVRFPAGVSSEGGGRGPVLGSLASQENIKQQVRQL